jgi:gliding motility-associated-like protein
MKHLITLSLLILSFSLANAQTWLWRKVSNVQGEGVHVAADINGNAYVTALFSDTALFTPDTLYSPLGISEAYVCKYDKNGNSVWARQAEGANAGSFSYGTDVAVDNNFNVYVTGSFQGSNTFGTYTLGGNPYAFSTFLVKYSSGGSVLWAKQSAPSANTNVNVESNAIALDATGNVYITGYFVDTVHFGATTLTSRYAFGSGNVFLTKYDANGNVLWAKQPTSTQDTLNISGGTSVATDKNGNIYVGGNFQDTLTFGPIVLINTTSGGAYFLVKYDPNGNVLWAKQAQTETSLPLNYLSLEAISADNSGGIYVTGEFMGNFIIGTDTVVGYNSNWSVFIAKYDSSGNFVWVKNVLALPGPSDIWCTTIKSDTVQRGGAYVTMQQTLATNLLFGSDTLHSPASESTWLVQFDSAGKVLCYGSYQIGEDDGDWMATDPSGRYIFVGGDSDVAVPSELNYIARWQNCCKVINANVNHANDTCYRPNGMAVIHASGASYPFTYNWSPTGGTDSIASNLSAGSYTVTISDKVGCIKTDSAIITNYNVPISAQACCDTTIYKGSSVTLKVNTADQYSWSPSFDLSCSNCQDPVTTPLVTTEYYITLTNQQGCKSKDSILITVTEKTCGELFVPNAFSPNGNNVNDIEYVYGSCIQALDFRIYDRWGNMVFETTDPTKGWDGKFNGQLLNSGVFDYELQAILNDGQLIEQKGNINLIR